MALFKFFRPRPEEKPLLQRCLSVDLEVDPKTAEIFDLAAVRNEGPAVVVPKGGLSRSLDLLEEALEGGHILGHNILRHDIEHLVAARPRLRDKMQAPIDTLWLNIMGRQDPDEDLLASPTDTEVLPHAPTCAAAEAELEPAS